MTIMARPHIRSVAVLCAAVFALSACTNGGRRPPQGGGGEGMPQRQMQGGGPVAPPLAMVLASLDDDHDTLSSRAELDRGVAREWEEVAPNGSLRALDYGKWALSRLGSEQAHPSFVAFDMNLDGEIVREEFERRFAMEFVQMDANGDSLLARSEMVQIVSRGNRGAGSGGPGGVGSGGGRPLGDGQRPPR